LFQFGFIVSAQPIVRQKGEMLKVELQKKLNDSVRVLKLQELSLYYVKKAGELKADMDSSYVCAREAEVLSTKINFQRGKLMSLILYSQIYREGKDAAKGKKELNKAFAIAKKHHLYWLEGEAYAELTNYFDLNTAGFKSRIENIEKAIDCFKKAGLKKRTAETLVYYGSHCYFTGKYKDALQKYNEARIIYIAIGSNDLQNLYSQIFKTYSKLGLYQEAIKYGHVAVKYGEKGKDAYFLADDYNHLGYAYFYIENYQSALKYHRKAFEYSLKIYPDLMNFYIANSIIKDMLKLGRTKEGKYFLDHDLKSQKIKDHRDLIWYRICQINVYDALGSLKLADKYCNEVILLQEKNKKNLLEISSFEVNNTIISHLFKVKNYSLGLKYLNINKQTEITIKDINVIMNGHLMEYKLDSASGNYLGAISSLKRYQKIKDSLFNEVKSYQISNLEVQYQTENKDQNIQLLTKESALQKAKIKSDKVAKLIAGLVLFLLLIITALIFKGYQNKKESNKKLEEGKNRIEKKNKILQNVVQEKEWLLKEIHHRVKNNLQVVMSLLNTQSTYLKDESAVMAIKDSQNRINSMSLIHQRLYQSEGLSCIKMPEYIKELITHLKDSYQMNYKFIVDIEDIEMHVSQAIPVGLILNEAITNAIKYAFPNGKNGTISIKLKHFQDDYFLLEIADNGVGINGKIDISKFNSLGMKLMEGLSHDINGKFEIINANGLKIAITFIYDYAFNFK
ncbi:MAG: histidine kinase dimerization/phosphoacceptor domain -containing protein, partial [Flavobacterium sp.]